MAQRVYDLLTEHYGVYPLPLRYKARLEWGCVHFPNFFNPIDNHFGNQFHNYVAQTDRPKILDYA